MNMGHDHSSMSGMSGMGGMDMGGDSGSSACSMSMLGNWRTINTCVLTSSWHIRTEAQFAGTCIGVFVMTFLIETVRRWSREFDRYILERAMLQRRETRRQTQALKQTMANRLAEASPGPTTATISERIEQLDSIFFGIPTGKRGCRQAALDSMRFRPQMWQQALRSLLYGVQFTGAYLLMLIAMTFNGYVIVAIVLGGVFGHFFSTWDTLGSTHLLDVDELGHSSYSNNAQGHAAAAVAVAAGGACCEGNRDANKDSASVSESSDDEISQIKRQVVTLPNHGYGSGACCV